MKTKFLIIFILGLFAINHVYGQQDTTAYKDSCEVIFPMVFSPNIAPKGKTIQCDCEILEMDLTVYNRWGKKVYHSDSLVFELEFDLLKKKDSNGQEVYTFQDGTYYYVISYKVNTFQGPRIIQKNGTITIIRQ